MSSKQELFAWIDSIKRGLGFASMCILVPFAAVGISVLAVGVAPMVIILGFTGILANTGKDK